MEKNISNISATAEPEDESLVSNDTSVTIGALILSIVFILGVPGNIFVMWSILARVRKRSVTSLLILNLAFADGLLMCLTIFFVIYLAQQTWVFGRAMCKVLFYLCNTNMYASVLLITLMSLHRLVAVVWPKRVSTFHARKIVIRVLCGLWVSVFILAVPAVVFRDIREDTAENGRDRIVCAPNHPKDGYIVMQYALETVLGFLIPYGVIIGSYVCILRRLRQTKFKRRIRSENLIQAIVVVFGIFWFPYHFINMVQVVAALSPENSKLKEKLDDIWVNSRAVTSSLAFISSCVNPVLYTFVALPYIRAEGLAFMARLFEGTAPDSGRKSRMNGQESQERDKNFDSLLICTF
ncbi:leukotriene B4 receptor 2b [Chanos chanos]|uniref:Leukotriene B4 receptor 2b n=1 Tax=Chanos chanos TaxID=29144 RepID=A0A6J2VE07_CHACN|nr:leukotriene B4 receptor 1-like [Chanos chanos]